MPFELPPGLEPVGPEPMFAFALLRFDGAEVRVLSPSLYLRGIDFEFGLRLLSFLPCAVLTLAMPFFPGTYFES